MVLASSQPHTSPDAGGGAATSRLGAWTVLTVAFAALVAASAGPAEADGTETLGAPSIPIAEGTGMAVAGTGLFEQPGTIEVTVPEGATVEQVLLYWEGQHLGTGDDTLVVGDTEVTGTRIGGPTRFFGDVHSTSYRADITDLGLVGPGTSRVSVSGAQFDARKDGQRRNNGAGLVVIYDDGTVPADIRIRDGNDLAFFRFDPPLDAMVPQTYEFAPAPAERTADLTLFASSVGENRPTAIDVTVGGTTQRFCDRLGETSGPEWSTARLAVTIPSGADRLTVEARSFRCPESELTGPPGSIAWSTSALFVPPPDAAPAAVALDVVKVNDADGDGAFSDEEGAPEVGAAVPFEVTISNRGAAPVVLDELIDAFGDVRIDLLEEPDGADAPALTANTCRELGGATLEPGGSRTCRFTLAGYSPPAGERLVDTVTVTGHDPDAPDRGVTASDTSAVSSPAGAVLSGRGERAEAGDGSPADDSGATMSEAARLPRTGVPAVVLGLLALGLLGTGAGLLRLTREGPSGGR